MFLFFFSGHMQNREQGSLTFYGDALSPVGQRKDTASANGKHDVLGIFQTSAEVSLSAGHVSTKPEKCICLPVGKKVNVVPGASTNLHHNHQWTTCF